MPHRLLCSGFCLFGILSSSSPPARQYAVPFSDIDVVPCRWAYNVLTVHESKVLKVHKRGVESSLIAISMNFKGKYFEFFN